MRLCFMGLQTPSCCNHRHCDTAPPLSDRISPLPLQSRLDFSLQPPPERHGSRWRVVDGSPKTRRQFKEFGQPQVVPCCTVVIYGVNIPMTIFKERWRVVIWGHKFHSLMDDIMYIYMNILMCIYIIYIHYWFYRIFSDCIWTFERSTLQLCEGSMPTWVVSKLGYNMV